MLGFDALATLPLSSLPIAAAGGDTITATGIASEEAFGTAKLNLQIVTQSIGSDEAFGTPTMQMSVAPTGIPSEEAFGTATLVLYIAPSGVPSDEAFGTTQLNLILYPTAIGSVETFGTPDLYPTPFLSGYSRRRPILIDHTHVDSDLDDITIAVVFVDDATIGANIDSGGLNIRFTLSNGTGLLKYERQFFDNGGSTATGIFWVKVSRVLAEQATKIYIYYKGGTPVDGADPTNSWDSGYRAVYHTEQDPSGGAPQITDSTSNARHATTVGSMTSGDLVVAKIGNGLDFDGSNDAFEVLGEQETRFTIECLVKPSDKDRGIAGTIENGSESLHDRELYIDSNSKATARTYDGANKVATGATTLTTDGTVFYHLAATYDGSTLRIYVNGIQDGSIAAGNPYTGYSTPRWLHGRCSGNVGDLPVGSAFFQGIGDEFRRSNVALSADRLKFTSRNLLEADNELSFGAEEIQDNSQTISPSSINSDEAFGTTQLNLIMFPSDIASAEAFGTATLGLYITPSSIPSDEAFGTTQLNLTIVVTGIATEEAFGTPQLNLVITVTGIASAEAFGTPQLNQFITPAGIASEEAFGSTSVLQIFGIFPSSIDSAEAFGSHTIYNVLQQIFPTSIDSAEAFGTATLTLYITPAGIASAEAFGSPALLIYITPASIASAEAFGTPQLNLIMFASAIASAEAFGSTTLIIDQFINAVSIASAEAFGTPQLNLYVAPAGIDSAEAFGTPLIAIIQSISPAGIASAEAFGTTTMTLYIVPSGTVSGEAFGATITRVPQVIVPHSILSAESFGIALIGVIITPVSIPTSEAFGTPSVTGLNRIYGGNIYSEEAFGSPQLKFQTQTVTVFGIASTEAFGTPQLNLYVRPLGIVSAEAFGTFHFDRILFPVGIPSGEVVPAPLILFVAQDSIFEPPMGDDLFGSIYT